jgi:hypothetical protein
MFDVDDLVSGVWMCLNMLLEGKSLADIQHWI